MSAVLTADQRVGGSLVVAVCTYCGAPMHYDKTLATLLGEFKPFCSEKCVKRSRLLQATAVTLSMDSLERLPMDSPAQFLDNLYEHIQL